MSEQLGVSLSTVLLKCCSYYYEQDMPVNNIGIGQVLYTRIEGESAINLMPGIRVFSLLTHPAGSSYTDVLPSASRTRRRGRPSAS